MIKLVTYVEELQWLGESVTLKLPSFQAVTRKCRSRILFLTQVNSVISQTTFKPVLY